MRIAPKEFVKSLESNFHGRMRIRWSNQRQEWQIEEKIARGLLPDVHVNSESDSAIRLRDGYGLVCAIKESDRTGCKRCGSTIKVPIREFGEVRCAYCAHQGRSTSITAGFFELNDTLLQHLRRISAEYPWRDELLAEVKQETEKKEQAHERDLDNIGEAAISDGYNRMNEVLQFGYTPKTDAMRVKE